MILKTWFFTLCVSLYDGDLPLNSNRAAKQTSKLQKQSFQITRTFYLAPSGVMSPNLSDPKYYSAGV